MNSKAKTILISLMSILCLGLLWYNFGPLPTSWTPEYRNQQARIQALQDKLNPTPTNQAEIERLEFEKAAEAYGKPYKDRINEIIAKWKAIERERPLTKEELEQSISELDAVPAEKAARDFELKWRKDHPNFR